jgi:hypothetical protein
MEKLLHYTWKHRLYPLGTLATTDDKTVEVIDPGLHNMKDAGPDFFNAKIRVNGTEWVGNVELHLKASDWFRHGHDRDSAYDNVILHVVTEADMEVTTSSGRVVPQVRQNMMINSVTARRSAARGDMVQALFVHAMV